MSGHRKSNGSEPLSKRTSKKNGRSREAAAIFREAQLIWRHGEDASSGKRRAALEKYTQAAKGGDPQHEIALGQILCDEEYPDIFDFKSGFAWILKAAMQGEPNAQHWIAREFATGENVERDSRKAAYWYRRAARRGLASAKYNLGIMYFRGDGVLRNKARGRRWVVRAAEAGEVLAIMLLADAYKTGEMGFPVNDSKATYWRDKLEMEPKSGGKAS